MPDRMEMIRLQVKRLWYSTLSWISDETFIRAQYRMLTGEKVNLRSPRTFNDKIQWMKINIRTDLMTLTADKFLVRDYVSRKVGSRYLNELYWVGADVAAIPFDVLPPAFVIKTNHASQTTVVVHDKEDIDRPQLQRQLATWLKYNYYLSGRQWAYKNIDRRIVVEKLLLDQRGEVPTDYKFFCFNGEAKFVQVDMERFADHRRDFYDLAWKRLPFRLIYNRAGAEISKPKNLRVMREVAESLAEGFPFVRVDLYDLGDEVVFGEITHYPESGYGKFVPSEYGALIGEYLPF
jgi:hypothetical protein